MLRGTDHLTPLGARKQLLIAESELNRARLVEEASALSAGFKAATTRVRSFGSIASSAAVLMASLVALRPSRTSATGVRPSRLQALIKRAGILSTLWLTFRSRRGTDADRPPHRSGSTQR